MRTQLPLWSIDDNIFHNFIYAGGQQHSDQYSDPSSITAIPPGPQFDTLSPCSRETYAAAAPSSSHRLARRSSSASDSASDVMQDWTYLDPLPPTAQIEILASAREYRRL